MMYKEPPPLEWITDLTQDNGQDNDGKYNGQNHQQAASLVPRI